MYKRGGYSVTILDKAQILPAPDAASTDINKIIRSGDYADPTIAALNVDAVNEWRKPEWEGTYHEYVHCPISRATGSQVPVIIGPGW
jgi:sarcosine oxidase/L-pipecolate oxidase